ncbi:MAG: glycosyltransferase family 9 protein [Desulfobacteraceae bacterium]|nr:glycosyltransferase family 9 protein [Desulfobacteraceae bacterium]MBU4002935.1 glycosyltransferase family 9 protein [Pseudomonadota bacterium]
MNLLLVQTSFLGDTILSTPVITGLRERFPEADLWMMTTPESAHLVKRDPFLAGVIPYDKRKAQSGFAGLRQMANRLREMEFDRVYALHRSPRTAVLLKLSGIPVRVGFHDSKLGFLYTQRQTRSLEIHDVLRNLSILSGERPLSRLNTDMRLFAPEKEEMNPDFLSLLPPSGKYVLLVPGSVWNTKRWSLQGYRDVIKYLNNTAYKVVLNGSPGERPLLEEIASGLDVMNIAGKIGISETLYVTKNARLVVCNDSMALHMASAFKIPNVAIFCATSPRFGFSPWKNRAVVVERADLPCKPCRRHGSQKCPNGTWECINGLASGKVIQAMEKLLG